MSGVSETIDVLGGRVVVDADDGVGVVGATEVVEGEGVVVGVVGADVSVVVTVHTSELGSLQ